MFIRILILKNSFFKNLKKKGSITEKELKYFSVEFKKATNLQTVGMVSVHRQCPFYLDSWSRKA